MNQPRPQKVELKKRRQSPLQIRNNVHVPSSCSKMASVYSNIIPSSSPSKALCFAFQIVWAKNKNIMEILRDVRDPFNENAGEVRILLHTQNLIGIIRCVLFPRLILSRDTITIVMENLKAQTRSLLGKQNSFQKRKALLKMIYRKISLNKLCQHIFVLRMDPECNFQSHRL